MFFKHIWRIILIIVYILALVSVAIDIPSDFHLFVSNFNHPLEVPGYHKPICFDIILGLMWIECICITIGKWLDQE